MLLAFPSLLSATGYLPAGRSAPPPEEYGNILIKRSDNPEQNAAVFSHWVHRRKYTCRVCHFELEFSLRANTTEITEEANKSGKYCGAAGCHDGKASFGHDEAHCEKCHNGNRGERKEKFAGLTGLPASKSGNRIDWTKALDEGIIRPVEYLSEKPMDVMLDNLIELRAEMFNIPPALFPHKAHSKILDCSNCHPDIFNIKKKTTQHFSMSLNLRKEFCGVCHVTVAFPMSDCERCHPGIVR